MEIIIKISDNGELEVVKPDEMSALEVLGILTVASSAVISSSRKIDDEVEEDMEDLDEEIEGQMKVDIDEVQ